MIYIREIIFFSSINNLTIFLEQKKTQKNKQTNKDKLNRGTRSNQKS